MDRRAAGGDDLAAAPEQRAAGRPAGVNDINAGGARIGDTAEGRPAQKTAGGDDGGTKITQDRGAGHTSRKNDLLAAGTNDGAALRTAGDQFRAAAIDDIDRAGAT